jgi:sirohydrochlorin ferrochelatase
MAKRALILVDHGSRAEAANRIVDTLAQTLAARLTALEPDLSVQSAHLEAAAPSLTEAITAQIAQGADEVHVQPLFLVPGRHASVDIPQIVEQCRAQHPAVRFSLGDVIGTDPLLATLLEQRYLTRRRDS